jgi:hypothetical protein
VTVNMALGLLPKTQRNGKDKGFTAVGRGLFHHQQGLTDWMSGKEVQ